jgi:hypothetical protein
MHWTHLRGFLIPITSALTSRLATQEEAEYHPLIQFKQHAIQTNEIFLLVADLFAKFCSFLDRTAVTGGSDVDLSLAISTILGPYETFQRNLWWDVAVAPPHEQQKLQQTLQRLVIESWELLNRTLRLEERGIAGILTPEYLARFVPFPSSDP